MCNFVRRVFNVINALSVMNYDPLGFDQLVGAESELLNGTESQKHLALEHGSYFACLFPGTQVLLELRC